MLKLEHSTQFKKDLKRVVKRGKNLNKLKNVIILLQEEKPLPIKNKNHKLSGDRKGQWECHIEPDWLLTYEIRGDILYLRETGTHSDLF